jgi:hypothetical protein
MHIDNLADMIHALDQQVTEDAKNEIRALNKSDLWQLHMGISGLIRSVVYYKNESIQGRKWFDQLGFPDDGSAVLGRIYWMYLRAEVLTKEGLSSLIEDHALFVFDEAAEKIAEEMMKSYANV